MLLVLIFKQDCLIQTNFLRKIKVMFFKSNR
uniref:Uncharacterized protein n=1 Tax=viral metagenome TaxID=1070528 RepID=A0A6C0ALM1_9ZZZZ